MSKTIFIAIIVLFSDFCAGSNYSNESDSIAEDSERTIHIIGWRWDYVKLPFVITAFVLAISFVKIGFHHLKKISQAIPESCFLIILGLLIGSVFLIRGADHKPVLTFLSFNSRSFFLFLLPPIILESAYSLRNRAFVDNVGTILLYAIIGTILNIFFIGLSLIGLHYAGTMRSLHITMLGFFVFSSIVAAVDPVAVLAIFQDVGVNPALYYMVFGESLFNDAVTVVVYNLMVEYAEIGGVTVKNALIGICSFFVGSFCSALIGFLCGLTTAWITKYTAKIRVAEPILVFGIAYLSYLLAEMFHFSGIIAIICCGLTQSQYACENISTKSYISVHYCSKVMASITESLIFIILGVMLLNHADFWDSWNTEFSLISLALVIICRFMVIFFLTFLINHFMHGIRYISFHKQLIMGYGGLRGAIAYALAFALDDEIVEEKNSLLCATYFIILFTIFIQGISMKPLVSLLGIHLQNKKALSLFEEVNHAVYEDTLAGIEEVIGHRGKTYWAAAAKHLSQTFLRPRLEKVPHQMHGNMLTTAQKISVQKAILSQNSEALSANQVLFDANTILPNVFGDELLEVCDERKARVEHRQKKADQHEDELPELRRKITHSLDKPLIKTLHYRSLDKNLKPADSTVGFEILNLVKNRMQKVTPAASQWQTIIGWGNANRDDQAESTQECRRTDYGSLEIPKTKMTAVAPNGLGSSKNEATNFESQL